MSHIHKLPRCVFMILMKLFSEELGRVLIDCHRRGLCQEYETGNVQPVFVVDIWHHRAVLPGLERVIEQMSPFFVPVVVHPGEVQYLLELQIGDPEFVLDGQLDYPAGYVCR